MTVTTVKGVIKMPDEGDAVTMHVAKCEVVEGKFGEQVKFTDTRGDSLFISRASADRQLSRIGFCDEEAVLYGDVDGNTLVFTRDHNKQMPSKPYWGIARVVAEDTTHRPSLAQAAKDEAERVRKAKGLPADDGRGTNVPNQRQQEELSNTIGKLPFDDDAPPPNDEDYPYADDDGMPPAPTDKAHPVVKDSLTDRTERYFALASQVAEFQASIGKSHGCPFDLASINAMTFSIWNTR